MRACAGGREGAGHASYFAKAISPTSCNSDKRLTNVLLVFYLLCTYAHAHAHRNGHAYNAIRATRREDAMLLILLKPFQPPARPDSAFDKRFIGFLFFPRFTRACSARAYRAVTTS